MDCQELQLLHHTLLKASLLIDSCLEVVEGCENHCHKLASLEATALCKPSLAEIAIYSAKMQCHRRDIHRVIEQSKGTSSLVCFACQTPVSFLTRGLLVPRSSSEF